MGNILCEVLIPIYNYITFHCEGYFGRRYISKGKITVKPSIMKATQITHRIPSKEYRGWLGTADQDARESTPSVHVSPHVLDTAESLAGI